MHIEIYIQGRKTIVCCNGKEKEIKTAFFKKLTVNDMLLYINEKG
jgi:hypothetical protein